MGWVHSVIHSSALSGFLVALATFGLFGLGWLNLPSGLAYDLLHRLPALTEREPLVVMIEADRETTQASLSALLGRLASHSPKAIATLNIIRGLPTPPSKDQVPRIWGVPISDQPANPDSKALRKSLQGFIWGAVNIPPADHGITRSQRWSIPAGDGHLPSLEASIARTLQIPSPSEGDFMVDFLGPASRIPTVRASQIMASEVPAGFAKGKVLLIDLGSSRFASLTTPMDGGRSRISQGEFHALAIDSVLSGRVPVVPPRWLPFPLLFVAAWTTHSLSNRLGPRWTLLQLTGWGSLQAVAAWMLLTFTGLIWPLVPLVLAHGLAMLLAQSQRAADQHKLVRSLMIEASRNLPAKPNAAGTIPKPNWQCMGTFLNQFLHLQWSMFFAASENGRRLEVVWASGFRIEKLRDRRRDIQRDPFAAALKLGGPLEIKQGALLGSSSSEVQYLVPLRTLAGIQGFWAFGIKRSEMEDSGMDRAVRGFAEQLGEMFHLQKQAGSKSVPRWEGTGNNAEIVQSLLDQLDDFSRGRRILETALDDLSTPLLILDLFGSVIQINPAMTALLSRLQVPHERIDLLPMLARLTQESDNSLRAGLRRVLLHGDELTFPLVGIHGESLRLKIRPLETPSHETSTRSGGESRPPFGLEGLVIEVQEHSTADTPAVANLARPTLALQTAMNQMAALLRRRRVTVDIQGDPGARQVLAKAKDLSEAIAILLQFLVEDARKDSTLLAAWQEAQGVLFLTLTCEGHGFPNGDFKALLERQLSSDLTTVRGLSAASSLVEGWGGCIRSSSELGIGTKITLALRQSPMRDDAALSMVSDPARLMGQPRVRA